MTPKKVHANSLYGKIQNGWSQIGVSKALPWSLHIILSNQIMRAQFLECKLKLDTTACNTNLFP